MSWSSKIVPFSVNILKFSDQNSGLPLPKIVGRNVSPLYDTLPGTITAGITRTSSGTFCFFNKNSKSFILSESAKSVLPMSDGPFGSCPGRITIVSPPSAPTWSSIKRSAPCPIDIIKTIDVIPITIPKIVNAERDLFVLSPTSAVLNVCFVVIVLLKVKIQIYLAKLPLALRRFPTAVSLSTAPSLI